MSEGVQRIMSCKERRTLSGNWAQTTKDIEAFVKSTAYNHDENSVDELYDKFESFITGLGREITGWRSRNVIKCLALARGIDADCVKERIRPILYKRRMQLDGQLHIRDIVRYVSGRRTLSGQAQMDTDTAKCVMRVLQTLSTQTFQTSQIAAFACFALFVQRQHQQTIYQWLEKCIDRVEVERASMWRGSGNDSKLLVSLLDTLQRQPAFDKSGQYASHLHAVSYEFMSEYSSLWRYPKGLAIALQKYCKTKNERLYVLNMAESLTIGRAHEHSDRLLQRIRRSVAIPLSQLLYHLQQSCMSITESLPITVEYDQVTELIATITARAYKVCRIRCTVLQARPGCLLDRWLGFFSSGIGIT